MDLSCTQTGSERVICMKTTVSKYSTELDIPATAEELLSEISKPANFADITGHILLLETGSNGATGTPEQSPGVLDVAYAYQSCSESVSLVLGLDGENRLGQAQCLLQGRYL